MESDTNSNTTVYITIPHSKTPISKQPTNLPTLNPAPLNFPNLPNLARAYRTLKRKLPNTPLPSNPVTSTTFVNHPLHTDTKELLQTRLPFFPQYTYFRSDPNDERPNYVNEHVLHPTLSWTSFYHFTNPLLLPLYNTPHDNEVCSTQLYLLTTALTPKQVTQIGHRQSLIKFTAPKTTEYSIDYYDHNIIRPN